MNDGQPSVEPASIKPALAPRLPWLKFYPRDWMSDAALRHCSAAARGVWIEIICLMTQGREYGYLDPEYLEGHTLPGDPGGCFALGLAIALPPPVTRGGLCELLERGVVSVSSDKRLFSRRLVRDWFRRRDGVHHGSKALEGSTPPGHPGGSRASRARGSEARGQRPEKTAAANASAGGTPTAPARRKRVPPPTSAVKREHQLAVVERWQRAWSHYRDEITIPLDQPIPNPEPYPMSGPGAAAEWKAAADIWTLAGGDLAEIERRLVHAFTAEVDWMQQNLSLHLFASKWRQLDQEWVDGRIAPPVNGQYRNL